MVDMGCQDYGQCKASQKASGMFNYKNPQVQLWHASVVVNLYFHSASLVENNPTAKTAARARNNATWHLLLDEDSTNMTFPFGKITRDLSKFFLRAIQ